MSLRSKAREAALRVLYNVDLSEGNAEESFSEVAKEFALSSDAIEYSKSLIEGVLDATEELDSAIEGTTSKWKVSRMAVIDRNILRIGTLEILHMEDIPFKVSIDEAVELAKKYGSNDSPAFVNGLLDGVYKKFNEEN